MHELKPLLPYLARFKPQIGFGLFMTLLSSAIALLQPYFIGSAVDALNNKEPQEVLIRIAALILGAALVQAVFTYFTRYTVNAVSRTIEYQMRNDLFAHLQQMQHGFFQNMHTGDIMARATNDLTAVRSFLGPGISNTASTVLMFVASAILMFSISPGLALIAVVFLPLMTVAFVVIGRRMHTRYEKVQAQFGELSTRAQENFSGIRVIKAYVQEDNEVKRFAGAGEEYVRNSMDYYRLSALLWPLMGLVLGLGAALILWVGGDQVINNELTLGEFVQFNGYLALLSWPMIALGWVVSLYQQGSASMSRINRVMSDKPAIADGPRTRQEITALRGDIKFRNVTLAYEGVPVLRDVDFHVPAGQTVAIVGATGAGKTSIVNLLTRVHDATSGAVLVDDVDVREVPLEVLRRNIGYVPQDTFLFSVALKENVAFGVDDPDPARIAQAVEVARLSKDVDQFPGGLETVIGERGVTLSGGQKQRTAIARAVMRDPAILILDDALSSIDTQTQSEILAGLRDVLAGRTSIIIAQRISTVKAADQILVLDDGRIVERGNHGTLLRAGGIYSRMYRRELLSKEMEVD